MRRSLVLLLAGAPFVLVYWLRSTGPDAAALTAPETAPADCARLVSLAPSITETLFAVGLGPNVVGATRYCQYPDAVRDLPKIGGYVDPSLTAVVALDPTLVVLLEEHNEVRRKLETLGIPTLALANGRVTQILQSIETLGAVCDAENAAAALLDDLRARMASVSRAAQGKSRPTVMIAMGRNMGSGGLKDAYIAGEESYYQDLIRLAGGENVYKGAVPFPLISREGMMQLDPEVVIDMVPDLETNGWLRETIKREWEGLPLTAVDTRRVYIFDAPHTVVPGPRFILTLEAMAAVIHPTAEGAIR